MILADFQNLMLHHPDGKISLKDMIYAYYFHMFDNENKAEQFATDYIKQLRKDVVDV